VKFPVGTARRTAAASLAAAALLGASGCSAVNYQATTHQYAASDGTATEFQDVQFRHMAFVTDEQGNPARAMGSVNNDSNEDVEVEMDVDGEIFTLDLAAGEAFSLENDDEIVVESFQGAPGSLYEITVSVNGESEQLMTSVFDGVLPEYRDLVPGGYDETVTDHLEHGPDTYGSGTSHHDPEESGH